MSPAVSRESSMSQARSASRGVQGMRMKVAGGLRPSEPVWTNVANGAPPAMVSTAPVSPRFRAASVA